MLVDSCGTEWVANTNEYSYIYRLRRKICLWNKLVYSNKIKNFSFKGGAAQVSIFDFPQEFILIRQLNLLNNYLGSKLCGTKSIELLDFFNCIRFLTCSVHIYSVVACFISLFFYEGAVVSSEGRTLKWGTVIFASTSRVCFSCKS